MSIAVAAVGAIVAALLELTIVPYLQIGGVQPDLVLVLAVLWTVVAGVEGGIVWAFVGGLMIDALAARPLGSTAFALLLSVGVAGLISHLVQPPRRIGAAVTIAPVALLYGLVTALTYGVLRGPVPLGEAWATLVPRAVYDVASAAVLGPIAFALARRRPERERLDW